MEPKAKRISQRIRLQISSVLKKIHDPKKLNIKGFRGLNRRIKNSFFDFYLFETEL